MDKVLKVSIVSPEKPLALLGASLVEAPSKTGQVGILPGHASLVTELQPGLLKVVGSKDDGTLFYYVSGGFLRVENDEATILVDVAESGEQINHERADQAEKRALERLAKVTNKDIDIPRAINSLKRAQARRGLARHSKPGKS